MPDSDIEHKQAHPHQVGWFWRLLGLFQRQSHPLPAEDDDSDEAEKLRRYMNLGRDRQEKYKTYDEMDNYDLVSSILDLYAEEATQKDYDKGRSVWIESKSGEIVRAGDECLKNIQCEDRVTPLCRRMCKYGDAIQRLIYQTGKGVLSWRYVKPEGIIRVEDKFQRLVGFKEQGKKYRGASVREVSWPWDYAHFRLMGKDEESGYGTSVLDAMFRPWRQMMLTEDAMLMYRLRRAPSRNVIFVDGRGQEQHEAAASLNAWRKRFRKTEFIDPASPNYRKQYNPLTPLEDIFILEQSDDGKSRVEELAGGGEVGDIFDLNHYRDKFFGAAKVPKAFMGYEGDINAKATLSAQDVRFARTIKRVQKAIVYGLRQTLDIHYALLPTDPTDMKFDLTKAENSYVVQMSPIAYLDEWERLELIQLRYQIIESMSRLAADMQLNAQAWAAYVLLNYAKLPEDLVLKLMAKTPESAVPPMMAGAVPPGMESWLGLAPDKFKTFMDDPKNRQQLLESGPVGFSPLSSAEHVAIARIMHESAPLRKVVGDLAEYALDDVAARQTDQSLLPPTARGALLMDDFADDPEAKTLKEDLESLKKKAME
jgi:hypothetical protein